MADGKGALPAHRMQGTADAEAIHVSDLVAFSWSPAPGDAWTHYNANVEYDQWCAPSSASGLLIFEGVAPESSFAARVAELRFAFSDGFTLDLETGATLNVGGPWLWNPAVGSLDPLGASGRLGSETDIQLSTEAVSYT